MRAWRLWLVVGGLAVASAAGPAQASWADAAARPGALIARDSGIDGVYALDGAVVYHRASLDHPREPHRSRPWTRVLNGRRLPVRGMPAGARGASIGRDASGRVVLTISTFDKRVRWWIYDVGNDSARRLRGLRSCSPGAVAVWRRRVAYFDDCPASRQAVILQTGRRVRRFPASSEPGFEHVVLRSRSLLAMGEMDEDVTIWRLLDRGRRCKEPIFGGSADESWWARGVWIGASGAEWVMAMSDWPEAFFWPFEDVAVMSLDLDGRCGDRATQRYLKIREPASPMQGVAIDGRRFYFAIADGLYRQRLPVRGSATAPVNDDFEHATTLAGPLPLGAEGHVGHAVNQPGEPDGPSLEGTVWYRWTPPVSQRVVIDVKVGARNLRHQLFTGTRLADLTPFGLATDDGRYTVDAVAGVTYWLEVGAWQRPDYAPFQITIAAVGQ